MIDFNELKIVDIVKVGEAAPQFQAFIAALRANPPSEPLISNYLKLDHDFKNYVCFHVCIWRDDIVAFSGLWQGHYPNGLVRALTRTYYAPQFRTKHLRGHALPGFATRYMLPLQTQIAQTLGAPCVFVSMQGLNRRSYFEEIFAAVNRLHSNMAWSVLPGRYCTCRPLDHGSLNEDPSCWQNVAVLNFKAGFQFPLPNRA